MKPPASRKSRSRGVAISLAALVLLWGCAARQSNTPRNAALTAADLLVREGCYTCLRDALAMLTDAAGDQPSEELARAAFATSLLLLVRARELGLPEAQWVDSAQSWGRRVPSSLSALPAAAYFDAIDLIQGETSGLAPDERQRRAVERRARWTLDGSVPPARARLSGHLATDLVAEYLALTLDCEDAQARKGLDPEVVLARHAVPLIRYRLHVCTADEEGLRRLLERDGRWVETLFARGRLAMIRQPAPDLNEAADLLTAAHAAFPESDAITLMLAGVRNALTDYAVALDLYDRVLRHQPRHPDALLGRLLALSYLNRHTDAVATATGLIELGSDHVAPAWYWRAWNRYHQHHLPDAWRDVTQAIWLDGNASAYALSGVIAYARQWPVTAVERLRTAYALDATQCDAAWTEASVHVDQEDWPAAAARFAVAATCFSQAAAQARQELEAAQKSPQPARTAGGRQASPQERLATAERRRAQSAFNAANSYARAGDRDAALTHLAVAEHHPLMAAQSLELKRQILKQPKPQ